MIRRTLFTGLAAAAVAGGALFLGVESPQAADHAEAPAASSDPAADIADYFAWDTGTGTIVNVITFAPLTPASGAATYDADVLYGVHLDTDMDGTEDENIWVRFGQNGAGDWGMQVTLDGSAGSFVYDGPVDTHNTETIVSTMTVDFWAGLADDPFFFDLTGFQSTLGTGTLAFDSTRDDFAGTNVTAIVIETPQPIDATTFQPITTFQTWATTSRL